MPAFTPETLTIETSTKELPQPKIQAGAVMVTPPLDENFWRYKVQVSDHQAVVGFPKFNVIGIGFQHEETDWDTNAPSRLKAEIIYNHIKVNAKVKADNKAPSEELCLAAIRLIQATVNEQARQRQAA